MKIDKDPIHDVQSTKNHALREFLACRRPQVQVLHELLKCLLDHFAQILDENEQLSRRPLRTFDQIGADRLADEVAVLVRRKIIDARSPAADALLDYREPPSTPRADRLAELERELDRLRREREGSRAASSMSQPRIETMLRAVQASVYGPHGPSSGQSALVWEAITRHITQALLGSSSSDAAASNATASDLGGDLTDQEIESIERSLSGPQRAAVSNTEVRRMLAEIRRLRQGLSL